MRPAAIFPGRVKGLLSFAAWRGHNLILYATDANELAVLDDTALLFIGAPFAATGSISGAIQPETGHIVAHCGGKCILLEAVTYYGQPPNWKSVASITVDGVVCIAWLDTHKFGVTTETGSLVVYSAPSCREIWNQKIFEASTRVSVYLDANKTVIACYQSAIASSRLMVFEAQRSKDDDFSPDYPTYINTGSLELENAWLVSRSLIAARVTGALFLWNVNGALVASLPEETAPSLIASNGDGSALLLNGPQSSTLSIVDGIPKLEPIEISLENFDHHRAYGFPQRILATRQGTIFLYERIKHGLTSLGKSTGVRPSDGLNLSCSETGSFVGESVLDEQFNTVANLCAKESSCVVCSASVGGDRFILLKKDRDVESKSAIALSSANGSIDWEHDLDSVPRCIGTLAKGSASTPTKPNAAAPSVGSNGVFIVSEDGRVFAFDMESGKQSTLSMTIPLTHAVAVSSQSGLVLVVARGAVECWDVENSANEPCFSWTREDTQVEAASVSPDKTACVAYSLQGSLWLELASIDRRHTVASVSLGNDQVSRALAWSHDSKLLAVLTNKFLLVFGRLCTYRGRFARLAELPLNNGTLRCFTERASMEWAFDMRKLLLFNGKQLLVVDSAPGSSSIYILEQFGLSSQSAKDSGDIRKLRQALDSPIPVYHPKSLLLLLQSGQKAHAISILRRLKHTIKFGEVDERGCLVILDPDLLVEEGLTSSASTHQDLDASEAEELLDAMQRQRLFGLTRSDQNDLALFVTLFRDHRQLDPPALCALYIARRADSDHYKMWAHAWFSTTKPQLTYALDSLPPVSRDLNTGAAHNAELQPATIHVWLDIDDLKAHFEQLAKKTFAKTRDPTTVMLYYVALHDLPKLMLLWRIASGHPERDKTIKLLKNDYTKQRWRIAAHKNAYALLGKHRYEYAAAFFLLGDSVRDCCQICVDKLKNMSLAIAVARVYNGDKGDGMSLLSARYCESSLAGEQQLGTVWLRFFISWLLQELDKARRVLAQGVDLDVSAGIMYVLRSAGEAVDGTALLPAKLQEAGIPEALALEIAQHLSTLPRSTPKIEETSRPEQDKDASCERRQVPSNLKAPPAELQLEPDLSAFGF